MEESHNKTEEPVVVVMVPLPAQGHLNQLLHFSRLISARGVPVHYVGSSPHIRQAKERIHGWDPMSMPNIHFHDFLLPSFPTPAPDPLASNKFPSHFQPMLDVSLHLREPLSTLVRTLSNTTRRVAVVHDSVMAIAAQEAHGIPNGEAYAFHSVSALAVLFYKWESLGKPVDGSLVIPNELPYLSLDGCFSDRFAEFIGQQYEFMEYVDGYIYNTCRAVEDKFIDLLAQERLLGNRQQWAVGPLNPVVIIPTSKKNRHKCLEWLERQAENSVLYVSFGTMTTMSNEQIAELAIGLELSEQKFVWVLREADLGDIYADEAGSRKIELPNGYEERVREIGIIVRDWAPQLEILAHPSTGGFLSHCGWNSCMESLSLGVPMAAWPMHSDQPRNTMLVTQVLKVGLEVQDWSRRDELATRYDIESVVRKLMLSEEGNDLRRRAEELGATVRKAAVSESEGGTSNTELDSFLRHISR